MEWCLVKHRDNFTLPLLLLLLLLLLKRRTEGCSLLDHRINENYWEELRVDQSERNSHSVHTKMVKHVSRMGDVRYIEQLLDYGPIERRSRGQPLKKLLDDRGSRVRLPVELGIFLFTTASRTALGPTQPPIQWIPGALSLGVKWPGREANYSPPSSANVKEWVELYIHFPNTPSWRGAQLKKKAQGQLYLTLPYLYWTDTIMRTKQAVYWVNFMAKRRLSINWPSVHCVYIHLLFRLNYIYVCVYIYIYIYIFPFHLYLIHESWIPESL
jgi:hypothetical protein